MHTIPLLWLNKEYDFFWLLYQQNQSLWLFTGQAWKLQELNDSPGNLLSSTTLLMSDLHDCYFFGLLLTYFSMLLKLLCLWTWYKNVSQQHKLKYDIYLSNAFLFLFPSISMEKKSDVKMYYLEMGG